MAFTIFMFERNSMAEPIFMKCIFGLGNVNHHLTIFYYISPSTHS